MKAPENRLSQPHSPIRTGKIAKVLGALAAVMVAFLAGNYTGRISSAGDAPQEVRQAAAASHPSSSPQPRGSLKSELRQLENIGQLSPTQLKDLTRTIITKNPPSARWHLLGLLCQRLSKENWQTVESAFREETAETGRTHPSEYQLMMASIGEAVGRDAVDHFLAQGSALNAARVMEGWARSAPSLAAAFVLDGNIKDKDIRGALLRGMMASDPHEALRLALQNPPGHEEITKDAVKNAIQEYGVFEAVEMINLAISQNQGQEEGADKKSAACFDIIADSMLFTAWRAGRSDEACKWLESSKGSFPMSSDLIGRAAHDFAWNNPDDAIAWWERMVPQEERTTPNPSGIAGLYNGLMAKPQNLESWLKNNASHPIYDLIVARYVLDPRSGAKGDPVWVESIRNSEIRQLVESKLSPPAAPSK